MACGRTEQRRRLSRSFGTSQALIIQAPITGRVANGSSASSSDDQQRPALRWQSFRSRSGQVVAGIVDRADPSKCELDNRVAGSQAWRTWVPLTSTQAVGSGSGRGGRRYSGQVRRRYGHCEGLSRPPPRPRPPPAYRGLAHQAFSPSSSVTFTKPAKPLFSWLDGAKRKPNALLRQLCTRLLSIRQHLCPHIQALPAPQQHKSCPPIAISGPSKCELLF